MVFQRCTSISGREPAPRPCVIGPPAEAAIAGLPQCLGVSVCNNKVDALRFVMLLTAGTADAHYSNKPPPALASITL